MVRVYCGLLLVFMRYSLIKLLVVLGSNFLICSESLVLVVICLLFLDFIWVVVGEEEIVVVGFFGCK